MKLRNKFEKKIHRQLVKSEVSFSYESEKIAYVIASHYTPDFILTTPLGKIYIECKGYFRPEDKRKLVAVKRLNPQLDLRLLFYAPDKITRSVQRRLDQYIKWAVKNGFKFAVERIPNEWLHGL